MIVRRDCEIILRPLTGGCTRSMARSRNMGTILKRIE